MSVLIQLSFPFMKKDNFIDRFYLESLSVTSFFFRVYEKSRPQAALDAFLHFRASLRRIIFSRIMVNTPTIRYR